MKKHFLKSTTIQSLVVITIAELIQISTWQKLGECFAAFDRHDLVMVAQNISEGLVMAGTVMAFIGRFKAGGLYTPRWMPGPNK